jgi:hypothetical protein
MTFDEWMQVGIARGWIAEGVCAMHDGLPMTDAETAEADAGGDPCLPALRVWIEATT